MQIASCINGRIRFRDQKLTNKNVAETVCERLTALPGVSSISVNNKTGSLLVIYSTAVAGLQKIMDAVTGLLGAVEEYIGERRSAERRYEERRSGISNILPGLPARKAIVNYGMLTSLLVSMFGILVGKKLHVAAGVLFLAVLRVHLADKRKTVLAWR
jgi:cation transport ATPase